MTKIEKQVAYIDGQLNKFKSDNISISTGPLPKKLIEALAEKKIKATDEGFWGYWKFQRTI